MLQYIHRNFQSFLSFGWTECHATFYDSKKTLDFILEHTNLKYMCGRYKTTYIDIRRVFSLEYLSIDSTNTLFNAFDL